MEFPLRFVKHSRHLGPWIGQIDFDLIGVDISEPEENFAGEGGSLVDEL
jgi:hypothetical protein